MKRRGIRAALPALAVMLTAVILTALSGGARAASPEPARLTAGALCLTAGEALPEGACVLTVTVPEGRVLAETLTADGFDLTGLPEGLGYTVTRISDREAALTLTGTPSRAGETVLRLVVRASQFADPLQGTMQAEGSVRVTVAEAPTKTESPEPSGGAVKNGLSPVWTAVLIGEGALIVLLLTVLAASKRKNRAVSRPVPPKPAPPNGAAAPTKSLALPTVRTASLQNIGRRQSQQDSFGVKELPDGVLAVVADGMGGLTGGDQVSQAAVRSALDQASKLRTGQLDGVLEELVRCVNEDVNRLLGPERLYKSGSTLVTALVRGGFLHFASVGDSRVYLYRGGGMVQLNREHNYASELTRQVVNGETTQKDAASDPQRRSLTSFLGMGKLKHVDVSARPIALRPGDRVLLLSDGVFNDLPDMALAEIVRQNPDLAELAKALEEKVLALNNPAQDNFTAVILGV